jgi:hypothetical protein
MIDPAPDYRWWYFRGQPLRVRTILYIPVKYRAATGETAGHIVVSFGEGG